MAENNIVAARFLDAGEELDQVPPSPWLEGFEKVPLVSLKEAVQPMMSFLTNLDSMVETVVWDSRKPADGLTTDESAAIRLYTMPWPKHHRSLAILLNERLRSQDQNSLTAWSLYLRLFLTAVYKLPPFQGTVWCSTRGNLLDRLGRDCTWWGIRSCTNQMQVAEAFAGSQGARTIFTVKCTNGRDIHAHSSLDDIYEVLLLPGSSFRVGGKWKAGKDLFVINVQETTLATDLCLSSMEKLTSTNHVAAEATKTATQKWKQHGITIVGAKKEDDLADQTYYPEGICVDSDDNTVYIVDCENHRVLQRNDNANRAALVADGQLSYPADIVVDTQNRSLIIADSGNRRVVRWSRDDQTRQEIVMEEIDCTGLALGKHGCLYVCDNVKNEVRRWRAGDKNGVLVAGGHGQGSRRTQLNAPTFIFVDDNDSVYVSDSGNHRAVKWAKDAREGVIVAGGGCEGSSLGHLSFPRGVFVDQRGHIYVADHGNDRVVCWREGDKEGSLVVGGHGQGNGDHQLNGPFGLSFDARRNLYVADFGNQRVQKFEIDLP